MGPSLGAGLSCERERGKGDGHYLRQTSRNGKGESLDPRQQCATIETFLLGAQFHVFEIIGRVNCHENPIMEILWQKGQCVHLARLSHVEVRSKGGSRRDRCVNNKPRETLERSGRRCRCPCLWSRCCVCCSLSSSSSADSNISRFRGGRE